MWLPNHPNQRSTYKVSNYIRPICVDFREEGKADYPEENTGDTAEINCKKCY